MSKTNTGGPAFPVLNWIGGKSTGSKEGMTLRDAGISRVSLGRDEWIFQARGMAALIAQRSGTVSINDIRGVIDLPDDYHPSTWGAIFKSKDFEAVGYCQATHASAHARVVRIYKLKESK